MIAPFATGLKKRDREGGFALLEAMVALAVLAAFSAVLAQSVSGASEAAQRSHDWVMARLVAEELMAEAFSGAQLRIGSIDGVRHGRHWSATVRPFGESNGQARSLVMVNVTVEVSGSTVLSLDSLRIGASR